MWQIVLDHLLTLLGMLIVPVGLAILRAYLVKRNIPIDQAVLDRVAMDAALYAENVAHAALKKDEHVAGNEKLEAALTYAEAEMVRLGLDKVAREQLTRVVESKLPALRATLPTAPPVQAPEIPVEVSTEPEAPK